jgi:hypothetical protein
VLKRIFYDCYKVYTNMWVNGSAEIDVQILVSRDCDVIIRFMLYNFDDSIIFLHDIFCYWFLSLIN